MNIAHQCKNIDVPFFFSFLVSLKNIGSIVYLGTIHLKYYLKHCSLTIATLFIRALFVDKHVFALFLSLYKHLRAHTYILEMYGK